MTTVRQNILTSFSTIMSGITDIGFQHVEVNRSTPVDLEVTPFPACFIYSGDEQKAEDKMQVVLYETFKWTVELEIWLRDGSLGEEEILGLVHEAVFADYTHSGNAVSSSRSGSKIFIIEHERSLRAIRIPYEVIYRHRRGQPDVL